MKKSLIPLLCLASFAPAWAQAPAGQQLSYADIQAVREIPKLIQQFDLMVNNQDQIATRLVKLESGNADADIEALRTEIATLKGEVAELRAAVRRDQDAMRREIVEDLTRRLNDITKQMQQNQEQALAQIQARADAALQAAEAAAKAAREQAEYTKRNASRPPAPAPAVASSGGGAKPVPAAPAYTGPYYEHVVEAGQTLSFIAKGFETTVQKILDANPGVKANNLRVGQKLIIPAEDAGQAAPKKK